MIKEQIKKLIRIIGYEVKKIQPDLSLVQQTNYQVPYDKINYGAGNNLLKDWVNVDFFAYKNNDRFPDCIKIDLTKRHPFDDNIFSFAYSEDFLEHLMQADQIIFLEEVYRTLKFGGILRLSLPGLEAMLGLCYKEVSYESFQKNKQELFTNHVHYHIPSFEELSLICHQIGFSRIERVEFSESQHPELKHLDTRRGQLKINILAEVTK